MPADSAGGPAAATASDEPVGQQRGGDPGQHRQEHPEPERHPVGRDRQHRRHQDPAERRQPAAHHRHQQRHQRERTGEFKPPFARYAGAEQVTGDL